LGPGHAGTTGCLPRRTEQNQERRVLNRVNHDWESDQPLSTTVVEAITEVTGKRPEEIPPLSDHIDPEALNDLFAPRANNTVERVTFEFAGHPVTVQATGVVTVYSG
jgi:hypothetical protein